VTRNALAASSGLPLTRDELVASVIAGLGDAEDVLSTENLGDGDIGVETTGGRFFITVTAHD